MRQELPNFDAYRFLTEKLRVSQDFSPLEIFSDLTRNPIALPETANGANNEANKLAWPQYYRALAAASFQAGEYSKTLALLEAAIQLKPDDVLSYCLHQYVFRKTNYKQISDFERCFAGTELLVTHISCEARLSKAILSVNSFRDSENKLSNLIVVGDNRLQPFLYEFNPATGILKVPSPDNYESLPQKIRTFFRFLGVTLVQSHILKVDDNVHCTNVRSLRSALSSALLVGHYGGSLISNKPFQQSAFWHFRKCQDPVVNKVPDSVLPIAPYANGPAYWLSGQAATALSKISVINENHFRNEIYEDRAVGTALWAYGFPASQLCFIESGCLKEISD
jgi:hypothetical protein